MSDKLLMRRQMADGMVVLLARMDGQSPWVEAFRAPGNEPEALAELDRKQRVFATPLVREVFLEIMTDQEEITP